MVDIQNSKKTNQAYGIKKENKREDIKENTKDDIKKNVNEKKENLKLPSYPENKRTLHEVNVNKPERSHQGKALHDDEKVDMESRDSFPASDTPSYR